ncbi:MAG TPA: HAD-IC family P-type ATPase, partial [Clostridium sp.]
TLGVAYKNIKTKSTIEDELETDMIFLGFITLFDPLKENIIKTVGELRTLGVSLKIITGDNKLIAGNVVSQMGLKDVHILTGPEMYNISDSALLKKVGEVSVFAEVEPNQKERIIIALKKAGYVVGYMGDGINDASALHAADVSISVDSAVDVAKEAADIVLLEKNLDVLIHGVKAGRITFANTLKYVFMATSANFGNMFSMAGASLVLPFLPLLPKQILLTNLLTDFPEMTIATDSVDTEMLMKPRKWDIGFIRKFMLTFGLISSIFDYITFGVLIFIVHATDVQFRTGWFIESVVSASLIVLVIRSRQPFFKSTPGKYLAIATTCTAITALIIPFTPVAGILGLTPIPIWVLLVIAIIIVSYIFVAEFAKKWFYKIVKS